MNLHITSSVLSTVLVLAGGCQGKRHAMTATPPGQTTVCAKCYDEIVKARGTGGPLAGLRTNKTFVKHACEDCSTEMSIYTDQNVLMVKCGKCAPEGVPCDRCVPHSTQRSSSPMRY